MNKELAWSEKGTHTSSQSPEGQVSRYGDKERNLDSWYERTQHTAHSGNADSSVWSGQRGKWKAFQLLWKKVETEKLTLG